MKSMHHQNILILAYVAALLLIVVHLVILAWRPAPAEPDADEVNRRMENAFSAGLLTGMVNPGYEEMEKLRAMIARGELNAAQERVADLGRAHLNRTVEEAKAMAP